MAQTTKTPDTPVFFDVRRPGCAAWAERLTEREARDACAEANMHAPGHRIVAVYRDGRTEWHA